MRWIGIDYGDTYLGVAVSNDTNTMSVPLAVILTADFQKHLEALILDNVRSSIRENLNFFLNMNKEEILSQRKNKFLSIGDRKSVV